MEQATRLVISISRQKGCGGAYLGQRIAQALGIHYLDRALITATAKRLDTTVEFVEAHDERPLSFWDTLVGPLSGANPWSYNPPPIHWPAADVNQIESDVIMKIAAEKSVVVVGRGASYLLRNDQRHVSIFLHAALPWRMQRTQEIYGLSQQQACKLIQKADADRAKYKRAISGIDPADVTQYHLALDTGVCGLDNAESLILKYVRSRFPDIYPPSNGKRRDPS